MKSPFTGGNVIKKSKNETYTFRNEKYTVKRYYFQCVDTGKEFSNSEVDGKAMEDLYSQYRERHGIPSPTQLKALRERYGLSAHAMSKIAGIGINQYGLYENGEMPTIIVGHKLSSLFEKSILLNSIEASKDKLGKDYSRIKEKVDSYEEPYTVPIENYLYTDYNEIYPLAFQYIVLPIKKFKFRK